jgi:hypothetical protein
MTTRARLPSAVGYMKAMNEQQERRRTVFQRMYGDLRTMKNPALRGEGASSVGAPHVRLRLPMIACALSWRCTCSTRTYCEPPFLNRRNASI